MGSRHSLINMAASAVPQQRSRGLESLSENERQSSRDLLSPLFLNASSFHCPPIGRGRSSGRTSSSLRRVLTGSRSGGPAQTDSGSKTGPSPHPFNHHLGGVSSLRVGQQAGDCLRPGKPVVPSCAIQEHALSWRFKPQGAGGWLNQEEALLSSHIERKGIPMPPPPPPFREPLAGGVPVLAVKNPEPLEGSRNGGG